MGTSIPFLDDISAATRITEVCAKQLGAKTIAWTTKFWPSSQVITDFVDSDCTREAALANIAVKALDSAPAHAEGLTAASSLARRLLHNAERRLQSFSLEIDHQMQIVQIEPIDTFVNEFAKVRGLIVLMHSLACLLKQFLEATEPLDVVPEAFFSAATLDKTEYHAPQDLFGAPVSRFGGEREDMRIIDR